MSRYVINIEQYNTPSIDSKTKRDSAVIMYYLLYIWKLLTCFTTYPRTPLIRAPNQNQFASSYKRNYSNNTRLSIASKRG